MEVKVCKDLAKTSDNATLFPFVSVEKRIKSLLYAPSQGQALPCQVPFISLAPGLVAFDPGLSSVTPRPLLQIHHTSSTTLARLFQHTSATCLSGVLWGS